MNDTTTLFLINRDTTDAAIAELAEASASRNTHLSCLIVGAATDLPNYVYGVPPYGTINVPDNWSEMLNLKHQQQNARVQEIEQILAAHEVSGDVQSTYCVISEIKHRVAQMARVADVACFADNMRNTPVEMREATLGVLFESPIGLIVNGTPGRKIERVMVAWDRSLAASRAVHAALPFLKEASEVVIACFDPIASPTADGANPGSDVAAWLSHHGCRVTVSEFPSEGKELAQCIQEHARETGADLTVMGAYGHARILQAVFGGTTRAMMDQTELPIFLAH